MYKLIICPSSQLNGHEAKFEANNYWELKLILYLLIIQGIKYTSLRSQLEIGDIGETYLVINLSYLIKY